MPIIPQSESLTYRRFAVRAAESPMAVPEPAINIVQTNFL